METVTTLFLYFILSLIVAMAIGHFLAGSKTKLEQLLEDEEQAEYLKKWRDK